MQFLPAALFKFSAFTIRVQIKRIFTALINPSVYFCKTTSLQLAVLVPELDWRKNNCDVNISVDHAMSRKGDFICSRAPPAHTQYIDHLTNNQKIIRQNNTPLALLRTIFKRHRNRMLLCRLFALKPVSLNSFALVRICSKFS